MKRFICAALAMMLTLLLTGCEKGEAGASRENTSNASLTSLHPAASGTANNNSESVSMVESKIDVKAVKTLDGLCCVFITNNSHTIIDELDIQVQYFDDSKSIIDAEEDGHDMILPGHTVVSRMNAPDKFAEIRTECSIELGVNSGYINHADDVKTSANKGDNCVIVQITNDSNVKIEEIEYAVVFYKGDVVASISYPEDIYDVPENKTITKKVSAYGAEFDRFEVYLNQAHTFK